MCDVFLVLMTVVLWWLSVGSVFVRVSLISWFFVYRGRSVVALLSMVFWYAVALSLVVDRCGCLAICVLLWFLIYGAGG